MAEQDSQPKTQPSRLLALPTELRDIIYDHLFLDNTIQLARPGRKWNIGVLRTCKQIRAEAMKPYYKHTTFYTGLHINSLYTWLQRLPKDQVKLLQEIRRVDYEGKVRNNEGRVISLSGLVERLRREKVEIPAETIKVALRGPDGEEIWATSLPDGWPKDARAKRLDRRDAWITGR